MGRVRTQQMVRLFLGSASGSDGMDDADAFLIGSGSIWVSWLGRVNNSVCFVWAAIQRGAMEQSPQVIKYFTLGAVRGIFFFLLE
jgi:hypothetical protein